MSSKMIIRLPKNLNLLMREYLLTDYQIESLKIGENLLW